MGGCPTNHGAFGLEPPEMWTYAKRYPHKYTFCPDCGTRLEDDPE